MEGVGGAVGGALWGGEGLFVRLLGMAVWLDGGRSCGWGFVGVEGLGGGWGFMGVGGAMGVATHLLA